MYIVFWFWFYVVMLFSAFSVLYRITVIAFPRSRYFLLGKLNRLAESEPIEIVIDNTSYSDWFLIHLVSVIGSSDLLSTTCETVLVAAEQKPRPDAFPRCGA